MSGCFAPLVIVCQLYHVQTASEVTKDLNEMFQGQLTILSSHTSNIKLLIIDYRYPQKMYTIFQLFEGFDDIHSLNILLLNPIKVENRSENII